MYKRQGDSRCYLLNENGFNKITIDHSVVEELVKANIITEEEAKTHPRRNHITRAIAVSYTHLTDNLFTYKIPEFLKNQIYVGHRVLVPFGKGNKPTEAFVFKISDTLEEDMKLKEVVDVLDEEPIFKLEEDVYKRQVLNVLLNNSNTDSKEDEEAVKVRTTTA